MPSIRIKPGGGGVFVGSERYSATRDIAALRGMYAAEMRLLPTTVRFYALSEEDAMRCETDPSIEAALLQGRSALPSNTVLSSDLWLLAVGEYVVEVIEQGAAAEGTERPLLRSADRRERALLGSPTAASRSPIQSSPLSTSTSRKSDKAQKLKDATAALLAVVSASSESLVPLPPGSSIEDGIDAKALVTAESRLRAHRLLTSIRSTDHPRERSGAGFLLCGAHSTQMSAARANNQSTGMSYWIVLSVDPDVIRAAHEYKEADHRLPSHEGCGSVPLNAVPEGLRLVVDSVQVPTDDGRPVVVHASLMPLQNMTLATFMTCVESWEGGVPCAMKAAASVAGSEGDSDDEFGSDDEEMRAPGRELVTSLGSVMRPTAKRSAAASVSPESSASTLTAQPGDELLNSTHGSDRTGGAKEQQYDAQPANLFFASTSSSLH